MHMGLFGQLLDQLGKGQVRTLLDLHMDMHTLPKNKKTSGEWLTQP